MDNLAKDGFWNVLIVDDEPDQHKMTKLLFRNYIFLDKKINFISVFNSEDAKEILHAHKDIALILLDVVMETNRSGLDLVKFIRNDLRNDLVQIILITGHPGDVPEESVVMDYSINAYIEKGSSDSTSRKLRAIVTSSLREYSKDLRIVQGMEILTKLRTFSDNIGHTVDMESLVNAIYNCFTAEKGIETTALFFEGKLIKVCNPDESEQMKQKYRKWEQDHRMSSLVEDYLFLVFREFTKHVFVIRCDDEIYRTYADGILSQAALVRQNLIRILNNERLITNIFYLTEDKNRIVYIKAFGDDILVQRFDEQKVLKMPFRDINLYFSEDFLLKINRSIAVNIMNIKTVNKINYRKMELKMENDEVLNVSESRIKEVENLLSLP